MTNSASDNARPGFLKTWLVATRPFALPASTMPVVFGSVLAVTIGTASFDWLRFVAAFLGMALLHTGANLINDARDYDKGIDAQINPVSGAVVRGWITSKQAIKAAALFMAVGSALGLWLFTQVGMPILLLGIVGVAIGVLYSVGPFGLKYNALGDIAVFMNFGVLGALGAWTVQTGEMSWIPAVWAIPMSILVIAILHANNWRDIEGDKEGGIRTMAGLMGDKGAEAYYGFLLFSPFAVIIAIMAISWFGGIEPKMPMTFLLTMLSLPLALKLIKKGKARRTSDNPLDFLALDGATAQFNLAFGLLCTASLGLHALLSHCSCMA
jgi:1,4-dihydroxy-2-naphthoate octaprenyltransferase